MLRLIGIVGWLLLALTLANAASGTVYIDTGGATTNSGTTDTASATVSASSVAVTCGATTYGGATPGCQLPAGTNLSGVTGDGSQAIYLSCMTNGSRKIAWITAVDDTADQVQTTGLTVTGCAGAGTEQFAIGGQMIFTAANLESAMRAGDTIQFNNSPAAAAPGGAWFTLRSAGSQAAGYIKFVGKAGVRPVIQLTNTQAIISCSGCNFWWFENIEFFKSSLGGTFVSTGGASGPFAFYNIIAHGGTADFFSGSPLILYNSEIYSFGGNVFTSNQLSASILGSYIHDITGNVVEQTGTSAFTSITNSIIESVGGRVVYHSSASLTSGSITITNSTLYGSGNSAIESADADNSISIINSIIMDGGNAAGEYNIEAPTMAQGTFRDFNNNYYHSNCQGSGTGGPECLSGVTLGPTSIAADPLFADAAGGDFSLSSGSPSLGTGYPGNFIAGTTAGNFNMGAAQSQAGTSGGQGIIGGGF